MSRTLGTSKTSFLTSVSPLNLKPAEILIANHCLESIYYLQMSRPGPSLVGCCGQQIKFPLSNRSNFLSKEYYTLRKHINLPTLCVGEYKLHRKSSVLPWKKPLEQILAMVCKIGYCYWGFVHCCKDF